MEVEEIVPLNIGEWGSLVEDLLMLVLEHLPMSGKDFMEIQRVSRHWALVARTLGLISFSTTKRIGKSSPFWDRCPQVRELNFQGESISDDGVLGLADILTGNQKLRKLSFTSCGINATGAAALGEALQQNTVLRSLSLESNYVGMAGAVAFAEMLRSNSSIEELDLTSNLLGSSGVTLFAKSLEVNHSLKKLLLCKNNVESGGIASLANALKQNTTLQELSVKSNDVGHEGVVALADLLKCNVSLTSLELDAIRTCNGCICELSEGLSSNKALKRLCLCSNGISDEGARSLADGIARNKSLESLCIYRNDYGSTGGSALVRAIKMKPLFEMKLDLRAAGQTDDFLGLLGHGGTAEPAMVGCFKIWCVHTRNLPSPHIPAMPQGLQGPAATSSIQQMEQVVEDLSSPNKQQDEEMISLASTEPEPLSALPSMMCDLISPIPTNFTTVENETGEKGEIPDDLSGLPSTAVDDFEDF